MTLADLFRAIQMGSQGGAGSPYGTQRQALAQRSPYPVLPGGTGVSGPMLRGDVHVVGQANPGALEAYRSIFGYSPADLARYQGRLPPVRQPAPAPMPQPRQWFSNDWSGMQRAVGQQQRLNQPNSLAAMLGRFGGF